MNTLLWIRVGDGGDYQSFDGLDDALDYLNELSVGNVLDWVDHGQGVGFTTPNYHGSDFISCFWGDNDGNFLAALDDDEQCTLKAGLEEAYI
jgi:hypothetical protein